jgi:hypothetical protein
LQFFKEKTEIIKFLKFSFPKRDKLQALFVPITF